LLENSLDVGNVLHDETLKRLCVYCGVNDAVHFYDGYGLCETCNNEDYLGLMES